MSEVCCTKKQHEIQANGNEVDRCVNQKSQVFLSVVNNDFCGLCPVRAACAGQAAPLNKRAPVLPDYPFCEHRTWENHETVCSVTGLPVSIDQCNRCDAETRDRVAKLPDKLAGYASAIRRWVAAGRPTRPEEEQKRILEDHCLKCDMYDRDKHSCKNCGCNLAMTGNPLTSKLAMGTEKCPLGRWE